METTTTLSPKFVVGEGSYKDGDYHEHQFFCKDRLIPMMQISRFCPTIDMIITSPPYNLGKLYEAHDDSMEYDDYLLFLNITFREAYNVLTNGGRMAVNVPSITHGGNYKPLYSDLIQMMLEIGFIMRGEIIWHKHQISKRTAWGSWMSPSNPHVVQPYEYVLIFSKGTKKHEGKKENIDIEKEEFIQWTNALWEIAPETKLSKHHPSAFPEELVRRLVKFYTYKYDWVLDPFAGAGTVSAVCKKLSRNSIYIDNSEKYTDFAIQRVMSV